MRRVTNLILLFILLVSVGKAQPGSIDWNFQTDFDFTGSQIVRTLAIQKDGKILIGGSFNIPLLFGDKPRNILRLNKDGDLDTTFKIKTGFDADVNKLLIQADGKILVIGIFSNYHTTKCEKFARLNPDGTLDNSFKPPAFRDFISMIALHTDNKILVAGTNDYGKDCRLIRINENGSIDTSFKEVKTDLPIYSIAVKSDGNITATGKFSRVNAMGISHIVSISANGNLNEIFKYNDLFDKLISIDRMILQPDQRILLFGQFLLKNGTQIKQLIRLKENGRLDSTFISDGLFSGTFNFINVMSLQNNGKIIIGGWFATSNGSNNIARLDSNGHLDKTFNSGTGFDDQVFSIEPSDSNKVSIGGIFKSYNSYSNRLLIRLNAWDENIHNEINSSIFPNPTSGNFRIKSLSSIKLITITDALGKEILRTEPMAFEVEIDLTDKSPGLYFVRVFSENESKCLKVFKR